MKISQLFSILVLVAYSFPSFAFLNCKKGDTEVVDLSTKLYHDKENLYRERAIKKAELLRAYIFLQEAKLCSQSISSQTFCEMIMPKVKELNSLGDPKYGKGTSQECQHDITLLAEAKALCEK